MKVGSYELPRSHLSASAISTFLRCPKQFEYRYVQDLRIPANKALALGSTTHAGFEAYYKDALESDTRLTGEQMAELTRDVTLPDWFEGNEVDMTSQEKEDVYGLVPGIVQRYVDNVGCSVTPVASEKEISVTFECGVPFLAYIDLVRSKPSGEGSMLVDYKVSGRAWQLTRLQTSLQFMFYAYITGTEDVQVQNVVVGKKLPIISSSFAEQDREACGTYDFTAGSGLHVLGHRFENIQKQYLEELVERCAAAITSGVFVPSGPDNWWCTEKWCAYWPLCRGVGK